MSNALVRSDTPSKTEWEILTAQADTMLKSGFLPISIKSKEQALAIALKGREIGVPMVMAMSGINVINGKPCISSELMMGLIFKNCPGAKVQYLQTDSKACVIKAARPGQPASTFSFSMEDAKNAGVLGKDNWKKFPAAMLRARCISAMARALFADAIMGCSYTLEELGAVVTDEGDVVSLPPEEAPKELKASEQAQQIVDNFGKPASNTPAKCIDPRSYVFDFTTKYRGMRLDELSLEQHEELRNYLIEDARKKGKPVSSYAANYLEALALYMGETDEDIKDEKLGKIPF